MAKLDMSKSPNAAMMKEVQEKAIKQGNARTTMDIPLEMIDDNSDNKRIFNMDEIDRLANVIKEEGFFGAIEVYQKPDGRYEISSGHRRRAAVAELGWSTIPAIVTPMPEKDTTRRRKLIASNINNRNMTPMDFARAIQYHYDTLVIESAENQGKVIKDDIRTKLAQGEGNIRDKLAEYFNISNRHVNRYLLLTKLLPEFQKMVEKGIIPWTSICYAGKEDDSFQIRLLKSVNDLLAVSTKDNEDNVMLTGTQIEKLIENLKRTIDKEKIENQKTEEQVENDEIQDINISAEEKKERNPYLMELPNPFFAENNAGTGIVPLDAPTDISALEDDMLGMVLEDHTKIEETIVEKSKDNMMKNEFKSVSVADSIIFNIKAQLEYLISKEFKLIDTENVKENIASIKECLSKIEEHA